MCQSCEEKQKIINTLVVSDISNGKKIQKRLRKKLQDLGIDVNAVTENIKSIKTSDK